MEWAFAIWFLWIGGLITFYTRKRIKESRMVTEAAKKLGLDIRSGGLLSYPKVHGSLDTFDVEVGEEYFNGKSYLKAHLAMQLDTGGALRITKEPMFSRIRDSLGYADIQTGDGDYDKRIRIWSASPHTAIALLNGEARRLTTLLSEWSEEFLITEREIEAKKPLDDFDSPGMLARFIELMCDTAKALNRGKDELALLMENIAAEMNPAAAMANIRALAGQYSLTEEVKRVLRSCLGNRPPEVQAEAARHLGEEGMHHLVKMLEDDAAPPALLGEIVDAIRDGGYAKAATPLGKLFAGSDSPELRAKAIECMGSFRNRKLSPFVVQVLGDPDGGVREAAVKALELCGTVEAVEPLVKLASSTINPFLKGEIRKAIDAIQAGIGPGKRGMLSVSPVEGMDGALSRENAPGEGALSAGGKKTKKK